MTERDATFDLDARIAEAQAELSRRCSTLIAPGDREAALAEHLLARLAQRLAEVPICRCRRSGMRSIKGAKADEGALDVSGDAITFAGRELVKRSEKRGANGM